MLSTYINITQVDFVTSIVYDSNTGIQSYQHAYFIRNNLVGDDLNDAFTNSSVNDPCLSNPCLNGASCSIGFQYNYVCICPTSFTGKVKIFESVY